MKPQGDEDHEALIERLRAIFLRGTDKKSVAAAIIKVAANLPKDKRKMPALAERIAENL